MSPDLVLAIIGLSLGTGSFVGAQAALWWRDRVPVNERRLYRTVFPYLDDRLGATKKENQIRAGKRFQFIHPRMRHWYWRLIPNWKRLPMRRKIADYLWAVPQLGTGSAPLPEVKRIAQYLTLELGPPAQPRGLLEQFLALFGVRPYRRWSIDAMRVRPSSEVSALAGQYATSLIPWVAWSLGLSSSDGIVIDPPADQTLDQGFLRYTKKKPVVDDLPDRPPMDVRTSV